MSKLQYIMKLNIGDWSDDGHGKTDNKIFNTNKTLLEVQEAYKKSCLKTGLTFNNNTNYTGIEDLEDWRRLFVEYDSATLSIEAYEILAQHISNIDELLEKRDNSEDDEYLDPDSEEAQYQEEKVVTFGCYDFSDLWWHFIKISLPDIEWKEIKIPNINGFWNENLNSGFGYGLFS